jgi:hypothetical protein
VDDLDDVAFGRHARAFNAAPRPFGLLCTLWD